ncbi:MAG: hypothetical protein M3296_08225, partial [Actinomycetota bacterium]|nr:hypothetical protein [Actinomycetota bacterium]
ALDRDAELLAALRARAGGLAVETVVADARSFVLEGRTFALILAPMQIVQLLGAAGRAGFLRAARAHLAPGGVVACALCDALDVYDEEHTLPPLPDVRVVDGTIYASRPVALRDRGDHVAIERIRETIGRDGRRSAAGDVVHLDRLDPSTFEREAEAAGLRRRSRRTIAPTEDHIGSTVVTLGG